MWSHHHQEGILVLDEKLDRLRLISTFFFDKNGLAFYPGSMLPPVADPILSVSGSIKDDNRAPLGQCYDLKSRLSTSSIS